MAKNEKLQRAYAYVQWGAVEKKVTENFDVFGEEFVPAITLGNRTIELDSRPARKFLPGERERILFVLSQQLATTLFGQPQYIITEGGDVHKNPLWEELEVYEENQIIE